MSEENAAREKIRILLADDHDLLRHGLKLLFEAQPDMLVVGEARNGREAIEQVSEQKPDVVVMDISMAEMDGLEACQRIRKLHPDIQVLILTMHESEEYFLQALRIGAAGYLVKKAAPTELSTAVRTLAQGGAYLYPGLAKALIRAYVSTHDYPQTRLSSLKTATKEKNASLGHALDVLTPREVEVLTYVAEGKTNQEIADMLVLSIKTVQAHRANVMDKLGLHDITQLVRFAIHHGLIPAEPYL
ncbi:response regulator transcription factor [Dictyobacter formicarum]|uniref:DNA-binding response regulator n=1 Tax=Dictyobacter formicarum TaxID=2778368 RepID=A0ABQ3VF74_9CHLR|nr:response regulator transcription factor [Dictyobacter formicarum]GHO84794.1 DNA-binding response regulator [Dictyobacter formicarum]